MIKFLTFKGMIMKFQKVLNFVLGASIKDLRSDICCLFQTYCNCTPPSSAFPRTPLSILAKSSKALP